MPIEVGICSRQVSTSASYALSLRARDTGLRIPNMPPQRSVCAFDCRLTTSYRSLARRAI
eukprot:6212146-Pleurochrysis_carterae.AAC.7